MKATSILIVDSNARSRESLEKLVEHAGHRPLVARTGPEALALISNLRPLAVLLDLDQLGEEAFHLLRELTLAGTDTLAIALSSASEPDRIVRAIRAGAIDYLAKPLSSQALLTTLKRALVQV
ncbi:MAG TPA: response regulator, partial [Methylomirabilota bacterium]|nr:response regulator [Methylomirabilota bacterium]